MNEEKIGGIKTTIVNELNSFLEELYDRFHLREDRLDDSEALVGMVQKAHEEWQDAEKFFNSITDPDLIDHAIYRLEAAKSRYIYLLKLAKKEGAKVNFH